MSAFLSIPAVPLTPNCRRLAGRSACYEADVCSASAVSCSLVQPAVSAVRVRPPKERTGHSHNAAKMTRFREKRFENGFGKAACGGGSSLATVVHRSHVGLAFGNAEKLLHSLREPAVDHATVLGIHVATPGPCRHFEHRLI